MINENRFSILAKLHRYLKTNLESYAFAINNNQVVRIIINKPGSLVILDKSGRVINKEQVFDPEKGVHTLSKNENAYIECRVFLDEKIKEIKTYIPADIERMYVGDLEYPEEITLLMSNILDYDFEFASRIGKISLEMKDNREFSAVSAFKNLKYPAHELRLKKTPGVVENKLRGMVYEKTIPSTIVIQIYMCGNEPYIAEYGDSNKIYNNKFFNTDCSLRGIKLKFDWKDIINNIIDQFSRHGINLHQIYILANLDMAGMMQLKSEPNKEFTVIFF